MKEQLSGKSAANWKGTRMMVARRLHHAVSVSLAISAILLTPRAQAAAEVFVFDIIAGQVGQIGTNDGPALEARFELPVGVAVDQTGNVYVGDWNSTVRRISPDGNVTTVAGKPGEKGLIDGAGADARFNSVPGLAVDSASNIYAADFYNHAIRKITPDGTVSTIAGGNWGYEDGVGREAQFVWPNGITLDAAGTILITDLFAENIRKITPDGVVTTVAGPHGAAISGAGFQQVDGVGSAARFWMPSSIAAGPGGNMYVADWNNRTIRKITPDTAVTTFAGATKTRGTNDGPALAARFYSPQSLVLDAHTNIYVLERVHGTLRKISAGGMVTTVQVCDSTGQPLAFRAPEGIAIDAAGNLYVADSSNRVIRKGRRALTLGIDEPAQGTNLTLSFRPTKSGESVIEYTDSLENPNWKALQTKSAELGAAVTITDDNTSGHQRFYRLKQP
jgi:sugar lactone lactonase YvrE